jgi:hypothetical protein
MGTVSIFLITAGRSIQPVPLSKPIASYPTPVRSGNGIRANAVVDIIRIGTDFIGYSDCTIHPALKMRFTPGGIGHRLGRGDRVPGNSFDFRRNRNRGRVAGSARHRRMNRGALVVGVRSSLVINCVLEIRQGRFGIHADQDLAFSRRQGCSESVDLRIDGNSFGIFRISSARRENPRRGDRIDRRLFGETD